MVRKNEDRFGPRGNSSDEAPQTSDAESILQFVTPTEYIDLPSRGIGYPNGHPLNGQDTIEIKHMTAKHEDILSSRSLLKSGKALEKLISSLICDGNVKSSEMLLCDRNAIIISARATGYGNEYNTKVTCPNCSVVAKKAFDLEDASVYHGDEWEDYQVEALDNGNYSIVLPVSGFNVEVRLLKGSDESEIFKMLNNKKKDSTLITKQMMMFIVSVEGHSQRNVIKHFVENIPSAQSRYLRDAYERLTPSIRITRDFECDECGYEQEMEVSLGTDFFWPER